VADITKLPGAGALSDWLASNFEGPAKPVAKALGSTQPKDQNAVSGVDTALSAHADKMHPVAPKK
jgi:hypothetical protein